MKFEHLALNVPDAAAMADWYVAHCGMQIVFAEPKAPHTRFLADKTGRTILEVYTNPAAPIPAYTEQHPLVLHVAFAVQDATATRDRLTAAGATLLSDQATANGTHLIMLRDPWGVALQLCKRATPMP